MIARTGRERTPQGFFVVTRRGIATIRTSKTGKGRQLPLNSVAAGIANRWLQQGGDWLFLPDEKGERWEVARKFYGRVWRPATKRAGISGLHQHDLRHTAASWAAEQDASLEEIQRLLGHSNVTQTHRYTHHLPDKVWPAAMALERAWATKA